MCTNINISHSFSVSFVPIPVRLPVSPVSLCFHLSRSLCLYLPPCPPFVVPPVSLLPSLSLDPFCLPLCLSVCRSFCLSLFVSPSISFLIYLSLPPSASLSSPFSVSLSRRLTVSASLSLRLLPCLSLPTSPSLSSLVGSPSLCFPLCLSQSLSVRSLPPCLSRSPSVSVRVSLSGSLPCFSPYLWSSPCLSCSLPLSR